MKIDLFHEKFLRHLESTNLKPRDWNKLVNIINETFRNKRVICLNEIEDGPFDILEIVHQRATNHTTHKESHWQLIIYTNHLSICTCSIGFFETLKVFGEAKHTVTVKKLCKK